MDEIAMQTNHTNGHNANMAYVFVLPEIPVSGPIPHGFTPADIEAHMQDAAEFNAWYNGKGIDNAVEKSHNGLFGKLAGKAYDIAAHGLSYLGNIAGKAVSMVPAPVRQYAPVGSLVGVLLFTACTGNSKQTPTAEPNKPAPTVVIPYPTPDVAAVAGEAVYDGNTLRLTGRIENRNGHTAEGVEVIANINGFQKVLYVIPTLAGAPYTVNREIDASPINYKAGNPIILEARLTNGQTDPNMGNNKDPYLNVRDVSNGSNATPEAAKPAEPTKTATAVPATPEATAAPAITNSYDFGKSLGLDADYLKNVRFDDTTKEFVRYLSSVPMQMRSITENSGFVRQVLADRQITSEELFNAPRSFGKAHVPCFGLQVFVARSHL